MLPKHIINKLEQLERANSRVAQLSNEIADWAFSKGINGDDLFYSARLDMPFEYDVKEAIKVIENMLN